MAPPPKKGDYKDSKADLVILLQMRFLCRASTGVAFDD